MIAILFNINVEMEAFILSANEPSPRQILVTIQHESFSNNAATDKAPQTIEKPSLE